MHVQWDWIIMEWNNYGLPTVSVGKSGKESEENAVPGDLRLMDTKGV